MVISDIKIVFDDWEKEGAYVKMLKCHLSYINGVISKFVSTLVLKNIISKV